MTMEKYGMQDRERRLRDELHEVRDRLIQIEEHGAAEPALVEKLRRRERELEDALGARRPA